MGKKVRRVEYELDKGNISSLPREDVFAILRAADEIIAKGGRNMLVKILKGTKDKRLLELGLDSCPSYGYYKDLKTDEIGHRIDWMIIYGYLMIRYDYRLPVIVFSDGGWELEKVAYADEVYMDFIKAAKDSDSTIIERLKDHTNRQVVTIVLERIMDEGGSDLIPMLEKWKAVEVKKVRAMIDRAVAGIITRE